MKITIQFIDPQAINVGAEEAFWQNGRSKENLTDEEKINAVLDKFCNDSGQVTIELDTETMTATVLEVKR